MGKEEEVKDNIRRIMDEDEDLAAIPEIEETAQQMKERTVKEKLELQDLFKIGKMEF